MKRIAMFYLAMLIGLGLFFFAAGCGNDVSGHLPTVHDEAMTAHDEANLRSLNSVTAMFREVNNESDPFNDPNQDSETLINLLVPDFLTEIPVPEQENQKFSWDHDEQKWMLESIK